MGALTSRSWKSRCSMPSRPVNSARIADEFVTFQNTSWDPMSAASRLNSRMILEVNEERGSVFSPITVKMRCKTGRGNKLLSD